MKNNWDEIVEYLFKSEECKEVHKFGWVEQGWIYVTERDGTRHKITNLWKLEDVKRLVSVIKSTNSSYEPKR